MVFLKPIFSKLDDFIADWHIDDNFMPNWYIYIYLPGHISNVHIFFTKNYFLKYSLSLWVDWWNGKWFFGELIKYK